MKDIAVFGGAFDPPTRAHEAIIDACLAREDIDEVWVMPSGTRTDKPDMMNDRMRLQMLAAMHVGSFAMHEKLKITDFEMKLPQPTQTYATVEALTAVNPDKRFWFVFGADSYKDMANWERGTYLQSTLGMLLVAREGEVLPAERENIRHLQLPERAGAGVSSTVVREAVRRNSDIRPFLSSAVAAFLVRQSCYKGV